MATATQDARTNASDSGAGESASTEAMVLEFKRRMLEWPNPVEYVNNMYGCHPGDKNTDYFKAVFGK